MCEEQVYTAVFQDREVPWSSAWRHAFIAIPKVLNIEIVQEVNGGVCKKI